MCDIVSNILTISSLCCFILYHKCHRLWTPLNIFLPEVFTSDAVLVQFVFEQRSESESITR